MHLDALISAQLTSHFFRVHAGGSITTHLNCKGGKKEGPDQSQEDTFKAKLVPPLWYVLLMLSILSPKVKIVFLIRPNGFFFQAAWSKFLSNWLVLNLTYNITCTYTLHHHDVMACV